MSFEVFTTDLDAPTEETIQNLCKEIGASGVFFYDPTQESFIFTTRTEAGHLTARRIVSPNTLGTMLLDRGIVKLMQEGQRTGARPTPRYYWSPYEKMLTRLPVTFSEHLALPKASGLYRLPCLIEDHNTLAPAWTGLHTESGLLFTGEPLDLTLVDKANPELPLLHQWLSAIQFTSEVYRGNLMGYIMAAVARPACPQFPFLVLDATDKKQGKTTVAEAFSYLLTGETARPITHTGDEHELEKRLAGFCGRPGPNVIFLDNVRPKRGQSGVIRSQLFAVAATSASVSVRPPYGKRAEPIDYPILILTMNEASVENDLHDRTTRVILSGLAGRYFKPHPLDFVKEHRAALLAEIFLAFKNVPDLLSRPFKQVTRFGIWERIAAAGAEALGLPYDFRPDAVDTQDATVRELVSLVRELTEEEAKPPTFAQLAGRIRLAPDNLPELAGLVRRSNATSETTQGNVVKKFTEKLADREIYVEGERLTFKLGINEKNVKFVEVI